MLRLLNILKISHSRLHKVAWMGIFFFISHLTLNAQNLIPNSSFENFNNYTIDDLAYSWQTSPGLLAWCYNTKDFGVGSLSDSIRKAHPNENLFYRPYHGQTYMRLRLLNNKFNQSVGKAFAQAELNDSLQKGCHYRFSMYILPEAVYPFETNPMNPQSRTANYASSKSLGAYFSKEAILDTTSSLGHSFDNFNITPQIRLPQDRYITDTTNYTRVSGTFKSQGGEKYITLGYFGLLDTMKAYKFRQQQVYDTSQSWIVFFCVDSLNLYQIPPPDSLLSTSSDTSICPGDSLSLFINAQDAKHFKWDNGSSDSSRIITQPGIYYVDAFYPCGDILTDTIRVSAKDTLPHVSIKDTQICEGEAANYSLPPGPTYLLNGDPTGNNFTITQEGHYTLTATAECESENFPFELSFFDVPTIPNISIKDTSLCEGEEWAILLPDSLNYELNNILVKQNPLFITEREDYNLVADNGCETRVFTFSVNNEGCETLLFVPNAFTPDGDGLNDCFEVSVVEQLNYHIVIFTRWGQVVYESSNPEDCWDGTYLGDLKPDVYTYLITVGAPGREIKERGYVNVVR